MRYEIKLDLSEEEVNVLAHALESYKGSVISTFSQKQQRKMSADVLSKVYYEIRRERDWKHVNKFYDSM